MGKPQKVKKIQRARDVLYGLGNLREVTSQPHFESKIDFHPSSEYFHILCIYLRILILNWNVAGTYANQ